VPVAADILATFSTMADCESLFWSLPIRYRQLHTYYTLARHTSIHTWSYLLSIYIYI